MFDVASQFVYSLEFVQYHYQLLTVGLSRHTSYCTSSHAFRVNRFIDRCEKDLAKALGAGRSGDLGQIRWFDSRLYHSQAGAQSIAQRTLAHHKSAAARARGDIQSHTSHYGA